MAIREPGHSGTGNGLTYLSPQCLGLALLSSLPVFSDIVNIDPKRRSGGVDGHHAISLLSHVWVARRRFGCAGQNGHAPAGSSPANQLERTQCRFRQFT